MAGKISISEQIATLALERVTQLVTDPRKTSFAREYKSFAMSFPARIHNCGIITALSYAASKSSKKQAWQIYTEDLAAIIAEVITEKNTEVTKLVERLKNSSIVEYTRFNRLSILSASFIKRYCQGLDLEKTVDQAQSEVQHQENNDSRPSENVVCCRQEFVDLLRHCQLPQEKNRNHDTGSYDLPSKDADFALFPQNASLLLDHCLQEVPERSSDNKAQRAREELLYRMEIAAIHPETQKLYKKAFQRRQKMLKDCSEARNFETPNESRLIVGLSGGTALDTSITLHRLYGMPMIPGSSIKGITAHYCSDVYGTDPHWKRGGEIYNAIFGSSASEKEEEQQKSAFVFYDAWLHPVESRKSPFVREIMTPHHSKYYTGDQLYPTDFDQPVPVSYLAAHGKFEIRIGCLDQQCKVCLPIIFRLVEEALETRGIGGKTTSGYGRLVRIEEELTEQEKEEKKQRQERLEAYQQKRRQQKEEEQARREKEESQQREKEEQEAKEKARRKAEGDLDKGTIVIVKCEKVSIGLKGTFTIMAYREKDGTFVAIDKTDIKVIKAKDNRPIFNNRQHKNKYFDAEIINYDNNEKQYMINTDITTVRDSLS